MVAYMHHILRITVLKNYKAVLVECKQSAKDLAGDNWDRGALKEISTDDFWNRSKKDRIIFGGDAYLGQENALTLIKSFGLSWERACGGSTEASTRTT